MDVPIGAGSPGVHVNAAIWWPEGATHNDVDLYLFRPDGSQADSSMTGGSVFEKVSATTNLQSGTWKLRVRGYSVTGTQTVYWAMHRL